MAPTTLVQGQSNQPWRNRDGGGSGAKEQGRGSEGRLSLQTLC